MAKQNFFYGLKIFMALSIILILLLEWSSAQQAACIQGYEIRARMERRTRTGSTCCGGWWNRCRRRCTRTEYYNQAVTYLAKICCPGYSGANCSPVPCRNGKVWTDCVCVQRCFISQQTCPAPCVPGCDCPSGMKDHYGTCVRNCDDPCPEASDGIHPRRPELCPPVK